LKIDDNPHSQRPSSEIPVHFRQLQRAITGSMEQQEKIGRPIDAVNGDGEPATKRVKLDGDVSLPAQETTSQLRPRVKGVAPIREE
jgi:hypothetical protein